MNPVPTVQDIFGKPFALDPEAATRPLVPTDWIVLHEQSVGRGGKRLAAQVYGHTAKDQALESYKAHRRLGRTAYVFSGTKRAVVERLDIE
jgi:hypothetical protein